MIHLKQQYFLLAAVLVFLLGAVSNTAYANNNGTVSLAYYQITYQEPGITLNPTMLALQGNYRVWGGLSIESRLAYPLSDDLFVEGEEETEVDMSLILGGYLKYNLLHERRVSPYVMAGFSYGEFELTTVEVAGVPTLDNSVSSINSLSYGVGLDVKLSQRFYLGVEYMNYFNKDPVEITATAINLSYKF